MFSFKNVPILLAACIQSVYPLTCEWYGAAAGTDINCLPGWATFGVCMSGKRDSCKSGLSPLAPKYSFALYCCQTKYQNFEQNNCHWYGNLEGEKTNCQGQDDNDNSSIQAFYGGCASQGAQKRGNGNDCLVNGQKYRNSEYCCENNDISVSQDISSCSWNFGNFGDNLKCSNGKVAVGMCGGGGENPCELGPSSDDDGEPDVGLMVGVYCCPYSDNK